MLREKPKMACILMAWNRTKGQGSFKCRGGYNDHGYNVKMFGNQKPRNNVLNIGQAIKNYKK